MSKTCIDGINWISIFNIAQDLFLDQLLISSGAALWVRCHTAVVLNGDKTHPPWTQDMSRGHTCTRRGLILTRAVVFLCLHSIIPTNFAVKDIQKATFEDWFKRHNCQGTQLMWQLILTLHIWWNLAQLAHPKENLWDVITNSSDCSTIGWFSS